MTILAILPAAAAAEPTPVSLAASTELVVRFVDDRDADDVVLGVDTPAVPRGIDLAHAEVRLDLCDFNCGGDAANCCGRAYDAGEEALVIRLVVLGDLDERRLDEGTFEISLDFGEAEMVNGKPLSILDAALEPGVQGHRSGDVVLSARLGQASGARGGGRLAAGAIFSGLPRLEALSIIDDEAGAIEFVVPVAELLAAASSAERAASGLGMEPLGEVGLAWWVSARALGNEVDRLPDTDDGDEPTVASEVVRLTLPFRDVEASPAALDFRGADECVGGDGDAGVVNAGSVARWVTLRNPGFLPMSVLGLEFSDPQLAAAAAFPLELEPLGGEAEVAVHFTPISVGAWTAEGVVLSDDPTPSAFELTGVGLPDEAPVVESCSIEPSEVVLGYSQDFTLRASDSASPANIVSCVGTATRIAGGTLRVRRLGFLDDGTVTPRDVPCDGTWVWVSPLGVLWGRGTWEVTYECTDRQGNVSPASPVCTFVVN